MNSRPHDFDLLSTEHGADAGLWSELRREAAMAIENDVVMTRFITAAILFHTSFAQALAHRIAQKLANPDFDQHEILSFVLQAFLNEPAIVEAAKSDLTAVRDRDPSVPDFLTPFLHFKGFLALQSQRVSHWLWKEDRRHAARHFQSRASEVLGVDIHPAARIGRGVMLDHGTGIVIGETVVVEDDVSILQDVTLGGTGKQSGDRHPKIRRGALIGAGAKILGNVEVGIGAKVGAGSVVVSAVAPYTTVVGVPARPIGRPHISLPGVTMDQTLTEVDYVI